MHGDLVFSSQNEGMIVLRHRLRGLLDGLIARRGQPCRRIDLGLREHPGLVTRWLGGLGYRSGGSGSAPAGLEPVRRQSAGAGAQRAIAGCRACCPWWRIAPSESVT